MHRNARIFLGSLAFLGVSILSAVEQAPYIQAGDDAEAFTGNGQGRTGVDEREPGMACRGDCLRGLPADCKGVHAGECLINCNCGTEMERQKSCSPRDPCPPPNKDSKQRQACVNGLCFYQCSSDKDCASGGGGICRAGSCRKRNADDVTSCKAACDVCMVHVRSCTNKYNACEVKCAGPTPGE